MGDLHSIAYSSSLVHSSSLGWGDFHNLGVFNAEMSHFMDCNTPSFFSSLDSDLSSGYLQDALFEFSSKRRRLMLFDDDQTNESAEQLKSCSNSDHTENSNENFGYLDQITNLEGISGEPISRSVSGTSEDATFFTEIVKTPEEISACETFDSSSSSHKHSVNTQSIPDEETLYPIDPFYPSGEHREKKKRVITRVVYPFAVVKPGGIEGDVTLNDINDRILMPPTRPVRHPVGDFASRPLVVSPDGPGLSGKAVVALTRIHTQGRGTITIIRTRG